MLPACVRQQVTIGVGHDAEGADARGVDRLPALCAWAGHRSGHCPSEAWMDSSGTVSNRKSPRAGYWIIGARIIELYANRLSANLKPLHHT